MSAPLLPGVWLGAWKIVNPWGHGYFGARHTALALVAEDGTAQVTEPKGWRQERGETYLRNDVVTDTVPAYGAFRQYLWILLAGTSQLPRFRTALAKARGHFHGRVYWAADSNRFVADVLWHARYELSDHQRYRLGWAPSFVSPHIADFPGNPMRFRRAPLVGALAGLLVSLAVWAAGRPSAPAGPDAGGEHLLFLVSLPWSLLVWAAGVAAVAMRGQDGLPVPLFHLMPVAAGAGWGWLVGILRRRRLTRRDAARAGA